jgi:hypothetical protein
MSAGDRVGAKPLDERCAALIKELRALCPGVLPDDPLPAGEPGKPIPVDPQRWGAVVQVASRQAAAMAATGRTPSSDKDLPSVVIWELGASALVVNVGELATAVEEGVVAVATPVLCDQVPRRGVVTITFAVGSPERPTGLLAATTQAPEGPQIVIDLWGEALVALAWQALLDSAAGIAAQAGVDTDGTPLVATALAAAKDRVEVIPQARHPFDRLPRPRAVTP